MVARNTQGRLVPELMSFDVFGTLVDARTHTYAAFQSMLGDCGAGGVDVKAFWEHWEERNIAHYWEPYRRYRDICELSLSEAFEHFGIKGSSRLIQRYFDAFPGLGLFPDVAPTLDRLARRYRLAVVSNIDDDLLAATQLGRTFDLVCTAERAKATSRTARSSAISSSMPGAGATTSCTRASRSSPIWSAASRSASRSPGSTGAASSCTRACRSRTSCSATWRPCSGWWRADPRAPMQAAPPAYANSSRSRILCAFL